MLSVSIERKVYTLKTEIGNGAAACVYLAECEGRDYALKEIKGYHEMRIKKMVDREIYTQKRLCNQPHIVNIVGSEAIDNVMWIVFELGQCSLRRIIESKVMMKQSDYLKMLIHVAEGLATIHNFGIIHRDIKPENIICCNGIYKITDFGVISNETAAEDSVGSPLYWPPEVLFESTEYSQKFDIWSFGVVAFEVWFGMHPFYSPVPDQTISTVKQQLKKSIKQLVYSKFDIGKFVKNLQDKGKRIDAISVQYKLNSLFPMFAEVFKSLFALDEQIRPDADYLLGIFESLRQPLKLAHNAKRVALLAQQIPADIAFFVDTLNLSYALSSEQTSQMQEEVEFHFQLAVWYLSNSNYNNKIKVQYNQLHKLLVYLKKRQVLEAQVEYSLRAYWDYLCSQSSQLIFFSQLNQLRLQVLLCSFWFKFNRHIEIMNQFFKDLGFIDPLLCGVHSFEELKNICPCLSVKTVTGLEQWLLDVLGS